MFSAKKRDLEAISYRYSFGKRYLLIALLGAISLFLIYSLVLYKQYQDAGERNELTRHTYEALQISRRIELNYVNMETGVRGYLLTGNPSYLEPYNDSKNKQIQLYELLSTQMATMPWVNIDIPSLRKEGLKFEAMLTQQIARLRAGGEAAVTDSALQAQKEKMDIVRDQMEAFSTELLETLKLRLATAAKEEQNYLYTLIIGCVLGVGGMMVVHLFVMSLLVKAQDVEDKLQFREKLFRDVMDGINDGVFDYDLIDDTIKYSPTYISMLGYNENDGLDNVASLVALIHPDDKDATMEVFENFKAGELKSYRNIFRMRHKEGDWRWILSRAVGIRDKKNNVIRMMGSHSDVTVEKNRERELMQLNHDIESFTYIASHDLRSPLVNLKGFASEITHSLNVIEPAKNKMLATLNDDEKKKILRALNDDIPEALGFIQQAVGRMDKLTAAILELSRIGRHVYKCEKINLLTIVQRCIDTMSYELSRKDAEISIEGELPEIYSDSAAIEQIIANLIDNSIKYLDPARKGKIVISATEEARRILFKIEDNGRGISEKDYNKVFEIFRRARNTRDVAGHGMGMAYVKATLRKLGGDIFFHSDMDVGTTFYFTLPVKFSRDQENGHEQKL